MENEEGLFWLSDRIQKIQSIMRDVYPDTKWYISFSGGKDSMILHTLMDMALPENEIPRVYVNTGIEYKLMVDFVKSIAAQDSRIQIITPEVSVTKVQQKYGYPFKSKLHSVLLESWQKKRPLQQGHYALFR